MKDNRNKSSRTFSTKDIVMIGMFAAVMAVISQLQIPTPGGVPVTIQVFGVALIGSVLGSKKGFMTLIVYILIGAVGAPVFAGMQGGLQVLVGTAGGYIWGWLIMVLLCGIRPGFQNTKTNVGITLVAAIIGLLICEFLGGLQWSLLTATDLKTIAIYSFTAFIPKDIVITILGILIGRPMRKIVE